MKHFSRRHLVIVLSAAAASVLLGFALLFIWHTHTSAQHINVAVTASGTDASDGSPAALTAANITALSTANGSRFQSKPWPKSVSAYNESRYIEFVFSPGVAADAVVQSVTITNVYRRNNVLSGAKLEVWDGTDWSHSHTLTIPANTTSDATDTVDVSSYINTPAKLDNIRVRFLAYNSGGQNTSTLHDFIQIRAVITLAPTITSVSITPTNPTTNTTLTATTTAVDADGDPLTVSYQWLKNGADVGTNSPTLDLSVAGNGDKGDSITVRATVSDEYGATASAVSAPVVVENSPPVVTAKTSTTSENAPIAIELAGTDADDDSITYDITEPPLHGDVTISGSVATYTPSPYYEGSDVFAFEATDGTDHSAHVPATITITPVNYAPTASEQHATTLEHDPVTITLPAHDPDNDPISYSIDTGPSDGTLSDIFDTNKVTYTPSGHFFGTDTFTFHASDGTLPSASATVSVDVAAVNDAPVASDGVATAAEDTPITILLSASDPKGTTLAFATTTSPVHGTLGPISGNTLTYTPEHNYSGTDQFFFVSNDGIVDSNTASESITITPVNDPPGIAELHDATVREEEPLTITPVGFDPESPPQVLEYRLTTSPEGMSANSTTGVITWTPTEAQGPGAYPVVIEVSDGTLTGSASFTVTVDEVNVPPAAHGADISVSHDTQKTFTLDVTDADVPANALTLLLVNPPEHGSVSFSSLQATYTPFSGYGGTDSFSYVAGDGHATSSIETVLLHVASGPENTPVTVPASVGGGGTISGPHSPGYVKTAEEASPPAPVVEEGTTTAASSSAPAPTQSAPKQTANPSVQTPQTPKKVQNQKSPAPSVATTTATKQIPAQTSSTTAATTTTAGAVHQQIVEFVRMLVDRLLSFFSARYR